MCVCVSKLLFLQIMFEYASASPGVAIYFVFPLTIKERTRWIGLKVRGLRLAFRETTFFLFSRKVTAVLVVSHLDWNVHVPDN